MIDDGDPFVVQGILYKPYSKQILIPICLIATVKEQRTHVKHSIMIYYVEWPKPARGALSCTDCSTNLLFGNRMASWSMFKPQLGNSAN